MSPRVEAQILSLFGAVHGVRPKGFSRVVGSGTLENLRFEMTGWSPSLHEVEMRIDAVIPAGDDALQLMNLTRRLQPALQRQKDRAARGLRIGTAVPLRIDAEDGIDISHVRADRGLLALIGAGRADADTLDALAADIVAIHKVAGYDGASCIAADEWVEDPGVYQRMHQISEGAYYYGDRLSVCARLPETLMNAVAGQRLGDLAVVPDAIADHVVTGWIDDEDDSEWTNIHVAPDLVAIGDVLRPVPAPTTI